MTMTRGHLRVVKHPSVRSTQFIDTQKLPCSVKIISLRSSAIFASVAYGYILTLVYD